MPRSIFISHAVADKKLVEHFVDTLLTPGLNLTKNKMFCTCLPGSGIRTGKSFHEYIKDEIKGCSVIILLITPSYLESPYCLAEAGASWVLEDDDGCQVIPIVVPPITYADLKATLSSIQGEKINDSEDLDDIRDAFERSGVLTENPNTAQWNAAKTRFTGGLKAILKSLKGPDKIDPKKYDELKETNNELGNQLVLADEHVAELKVLIEELEKCKDKDEVLDVKLKHSDDLGHFEGLLGKLKNVLSGNGSFAIKLLYYGFNDLQITVPEIGTSDSDEFWAAFRRAEEQSFVFDHPAKGVNMDHPKFKKVAKTLQEISDFIQDDSGELENFVENEWECTLDMRDLVFWKNITVARDLRPRPRN